MAPLIQDSDISFTCSDVVFDNHKPLHFGCSDEATHQRTTKSLKSVSFGAMEVTHTVMSRYEYTEEELENSFFDANDMKRMKETARMEGRLLDANRLSHDNNSPRGLEHRTREGFKRKRQNRVNAYAAVFFEVDFQQQECYEDADAIADAYFAYSEPCAVMAHTFGKRDELEAMQIYDEEDSAEFWSFL